MHFFIIIILQKSVDQKSREEDLERGERPDATLPYRNVNLKKRSLANIELN